MFGAKRGLSRAKITSRGPPALAKIFPVGQRYPRDVSTGEGALAQRGTWMDARPIACPWLHEADALTSGESHLPTDYAYPEEAETQEEGRGRFRRARRRRSVHRPSVAS